MCCVYRKTYYLYITIKHNHDMKTQNNAVLQQFTLQVLLIDPINKIVSDLKSNNFRDCDVKWLDNKLAQFTELAAKTLGVKFVTWPLNGKVMNDYTKAQYITRFNTLLEYFKTF